MKNANPTLPTSKLFRWGLGGLSVLIVGGLVFWKFFWIPSIERVAREISLAYADGNPIVLERWAYDQERKDLGLDRAKIAAIFTKFVRPRMGDFHPVGEMTSEVAQDGSQGMAYLHLRNAKGQQLDISATPWQTPDGPRVNVLFNLLCNAWRAEYIIKQGIPISSRSTLQARLQGLKKDAPALSALGVSGFVKDVPEGGILTWQEMEEKTAAKLSQLDAAVASNMR